jgi:hypothetical protein
MVSQGPNNGSTFANDGSGVDWANPSYAQYYDSDRATVALADGQISKYLMATGFGFSIPTGATIIGIHVEMLRYAPLKEISDYHVYIVKGGTRTGTDKKRVGYWFGSEIPGYDNFGDPNNLWGTTWTPSDINASNFGVSIQADNHAEDTPDTGYLNHIRITVYYSLPPSISYQIDSALEKLGITKSVGIDVMLKKPGTAAYFSPEYFSPLYFQTGYPAGIVAYSIDALLRELGLTAQHSIGALLNKLDLTSEYSLDVLLKSLVYSVVFAADVALQRKPSTKAYFSARYFSPEYFRTAPVGTSQYDLDAVLQSLDLAAVHSIDLPIKSLDQFAKFSIDVILNYVTLTKDHSIDTLLKRLGFSDTVAVDVVLKGTGKTATYTIDVIFVTRHSTTFGLNLVLIKSCLHGLGVTAYLISGQKFEVTVSFDQFTADPSFETFEVMPSFESFEIKPYFQEV